MAHIVPISTSVPLDGGYSLLVSVYPWLLKYKIGYRSLRTSSQGYRSWFILSSWSQCVTVYTVQCTLSYRSWFILSFWSLCIMVYKVQCTLSYRSSAPGLSVLQSTRPNVVLFFPRCQAQCLKGYRVWLNH